MEVHHTPIPPLWWTAITHSVTQLAEAFRINMLFSLSATERLVDIQGCQFRTFPPQELECCRALVCKLGDGNQGSRSQEDSLALRISHGYHDRGSRGQGRRWFARGERSQTQSLRKISVKAAVLQDSQKINSRYAILPNLSLAHARNHPRPC